MDVEYRLESNVQFRLVVAFLAGGGLEAALHEWNFRGLAGEDAAKRRMRKAGRKVMSQVDYNHAVKQLAACWDEDATASAVFFYASSLRQHFLCFLPLPHGQGSLRPTFGAFRT